ncbi:MAG: GNAT family N-acetyltransferase [Nitrospirae bacterium]|nr:GNAT family N-acetyltransferase [Nitrospirota bacterium]
MEKKESAKVTGISDITGKTVKVRHATEADMASIEDQLRKNAMSAVNPDFREFVVAVEDGHIIGFGRLRKAGKFYQLGCVAVLEEMRNRGIGALIVRHLIESAPVSLVYIPVELEDYFAKLGFVRMKEGSKELYDALDEACGIAGRPNTIIMVYEREGAAKG